MREGGGGLLSASPPVIMSNAEVLKLEPRTSVGVRRGEYLYSWMGKHYIFILVAL